MFIYQQSVTDSRGDNASAMAEYLYEKQLIKEIHNMPANGITPTAEHKRVYLKLFRNLRENRAFLRPKICF